MALLTPPSTCAVSIVVPMYNAEKYISVLLESLLAQTFQNFEVIIVDDCSTDNSVAVVKSYIPKFNGQLKLSRMERNSGGPGAPTNKGIAHSRGKYIFQMDNDDLLINNALEVLYTTAETFKTDAIYLSSVFYFKNDPKNPSPDFEHLKIQSTRMSEPTFDPEDCGERIQLFCKSRTRVPAWRKFVRRDLLIENEIIFPEGVRGTHDMIWTMQLICHAKRFLRIPNPLYIYRLRPDSLCHIKLSVRDGLNHRGYSILKGMEFLCDFFRKHKFFQDNPQYTWMFLKWLERRYRRQFTLSLLKISPEKSQKILQSFFANKFGKFGDLLAYFCVSLYNKEISIKQHMEKIAKLEARIAELEKQLKISSK